MCDEFSISEDVRVIHNELEKAYSWIFAAQEILRPENEEFEPDLKDINHIETAIAFAIGDLQESLTLCQIYRANREDPPKEVKKTQSLAITKIEDLADVLKPTKLPTVDLLKVQDAQAALRNLETKLELLRADPALRRIKIDKPDPALYRKQ
jgi:hypothetical protein